MIAPRYYLPYALFLGTACFSPILYHLSLLFTWVSLHVPSETLQLVPFCVSSKLELFKDKAWIVYVSLEFYARAEATGEEWVLTCRRTGVLSQSEIIGLLSSPSLFSYLLLIWQQIFMQDVNKKTIFLTLLSVVESRKTGISDHSSPWTWMASAGVDSSCRAVDHVPSLLATAPNRQTCYMMSPA